MIWPRLLNWIAKSPIIGYGISDIDTMWARLGTSHAHQGWLEFFYMGGILLVILVIVLTLIAIHNFEIPMGDKSYVPIVVLFVYYMIWFVSDSNTLAIESYYYMILMYIMSRHKTISQITNTDNAWRFA
jgi:O-antigen ligase